MTAASAEVTLGDAIDRRMLEYRGELTSASTERAVFAELSIEGRVAHEHLADGLPTPVTSVSTDHGVLWVKRDDLASSLYGGNKVRKLEYVLADAHERDYSPLVVGGTASHHVLAAVLFARLLGIDCEVVLFPQPPTREQRVVRAVLDAFDVPIHRASTTNGTPWAVVTALGSSLARRRRLRLIYPGSSSPAGALGYVDCGLEIARSVRAGECPEPAVVYTAYGTGGTAVGLALGLALGGLGSRVCAVRVAEPVVSNRTHLGLIERRTRRLLRSLGVHAESTMHRVTLETSYLGRGYGHDLERAASAVELAHRSGIPVDQTYTAKALAAALDRQRRVPEEPVMFMETLSGAYPVPELDALI